MVRRMMFSLLTAAAVAMVCAHGLTEKQKAWLNEVKQLKEKKELKAKKEKHPKHSHHHHLHEGDGQDQDAQQDQETRTELLQERKEERRELRKEKQELKAELAREKLQERKEERRELRKEKQELKAELAREKRQEHKDSINDKRADEHTGSLKHGLKAERAAKEKADGLLEALSQASNRMTKGLSQASAQTAVNNIIDDATSALEGARVVALRELDAQLAELEHAIPSIKAESKSAQLANVDALVSTSKYDLERVQAITKGELKSLSQGLESLRQKDEASLASVKYLEHAAVVAAKEWLAVANHTETLRTATGTASNTSSQDHLLILRGSRDMREKAEDTAAAVKQLVDANHMLVETGVEIEKQKLKNQVVERAQTLNNLAMKLQKVEAPKPQPQATEQRGDAVQPAEVDCSEFDSDQQQCDAHGCQYDAFVLSRMSSQCEKASSAGLVAAPHSAYRAGTAMAATVAVLAGGLTASYVRCKRRTVRDAPLLLG
eukprot:gnl/TRDRNA2_/TRDRNA2_165876_c0_seq1.p1 gnl/TRDRNA2_/TRDRNA2_165876_c0~~gnl/TRDRNA2_/TRDRNA2_165876_c0_seq1.p1  ORF type:complete len:493 (-),score=131.51 gnl/TRDRNA2_/TRDRNA2_165876_c0_seq1:48-1526(-)